MDLREERIPKESEHQGSCWCEIMAQDTLQALTCSISGDAQQDHGAYALLLVLYNPGYSRYR